MVGQERAAALPARSSAQRSAMFPRLRVISSHFRPDGAGARAWRVPRARRPLGCRGTGCGRRLISVPRAGTCLDASTCGAGPPRPARALVPCCLFPPYKYHGLVPCVKLGSQRERNLASLVTLGFPLPYLAASTSATLVRESAHAATSRRLPSSISREPRGSNHRESTPWRTTAHERLTGPT